MAWDKKYYSEIRKFVKWNLEHRSIHLEGRIECPVEHAKTFFPLITMSIQNEDWEAAKATKDAIICFLKKFGLKIPKDAALKIPETYTYPLGGVHISWGDPNDPSGMATGNPPDGIPPKFVY